MLICLTSPIALRTILHFFSFHLLQSTCENLHVWPCQLLQNTVRTSVHILLVQFSRYFCTAKTATLCQSASPFLWELSQITRWSLLFLLWKKFFSLMLMNEWLWSTKICIYIDSSVQHRVEHNAIIFTIYMPRKKCYRQLWLWKQSKYHCTKSSLKHLRKHLLNHLSRITERCSANLHSFWRIRDIQSFLKSP